MKEHKGEQTLLIASILHIQIYIVFRLSPEEKELRKRKMVINKLSYIYKKFVYLCIPCIEVKSQIMSSGKLGYVTNITKTSRFSSIINAPSQTNGQQHDGKTAQQFRGQKCMQVLCQARTCPSSQMNVLGAHVSLSSVSIHSDSTLLVSGS